MKLFIDPGHGGDNEGCAHNGLIEKQLTLQLGSIMRAVATAMGAGVGMSRTGDQAVGLSARGVMSVGYDAVVCLHFDAAATPEPGELRCYVLPGDIESALRGQIIEAHAPLPLRPATPAVTVATPGTWTDHAHNVLAPHRPRPVVLVECGFLTNPGNVEFLRSVDGMGELAAGLCLGAMQRLLR